MKSFGRIFTAFFLMFLLHGCLEYEEELRLNYDQSGEMTFRIGINEALANSSGSSGMNEFDADSIRQSFEGSDGVEYLGSNTFSRDGVRWLETRFAFNSLKALEQWSSKGKQNSLMGEISIKETPDGYVFSRTVFAKESNDDSTDAPGSGMLAMMFGNYRWKYTVFFPMKITEANTSKENIDAGSHSATWSFPMSDLLTKPHVMTASFVKSRAGTTNTVMIIGMICVVLVIIFYYYDRKKHAAVKS